MSLSSLPDDCVGRLIMFMDTETKIAFRSCCAALSAAQPCATKVIVITRGALSLSLPAWTANLPALDELVVHGTPSQDEFRALAERFAPRSLVDLRRAHPVAGLAALLLWTTQDVVTSDGSRFVGWGFDCIGRPISSRLRLDEVCIHGDDPVVTARRYAAARDWRPLRLTVSQLDPGADPSAHAAVPDGTRICAQLTGVQSVPLARSLVAPVHSIEVGGLGIDGLVEALWVLVARQRQCRLLLGHAIRDWALLEAGLARSGVDRGQLVGAVRSLRCGDTPPMGWTDRCLPGLRKIRILWCACADTASFEDLCASVRQVRMCWCTGALQALHRGASRRTGLVPPLRVRFNECLPYCSTRNPSALAAGLDTDPEWVLAFRAMREHPRIGVIA